MAFPEAGNTSFVGERTKETVTGVITRVYATGGDFTIRLSDGREAKFRMLTIELPRGAGQSFRKANSVHELRRETANFIVVTGFRSPPGNHIRG